MVRSGRYHVELFAESGSLSVCAQRAELLQGREHGRQRSLVHRLLSRACPTSAHSVPRDGVRSPFLEHQPALLHTGVPKGMAIASGIRDCLAHRPSSSGQLLLQLAEGLATLYTDATHAGSSPYRNGNYVPPKPEPPLRMRKD